MAGSVQEQLAAAEEVAGQRERLRAAFVVERWPVATAVATGIGAWIGANVVGLLRLPLVVTVVVVVAGLVLRRPGVVCVGVLVLATTLAQRSVDGLAPVRRGPIQDEVTLLTDPAPTPGGAVRAEVRWGHRRLAAAAHDAAATALDHRLAGERIIVRGQLEPPGRYEQRLRHRHLVGRLRVDTVVGWSTGHGVTRAANGLRRTLEQGAASLPPRHEALLMGLVLGDDRRQSPDLTDAFHAAGLAHLLAVSGQNVAFVMALGAPLTMRMRFGPRLVTTLAALAGFALVTRGEPSVLRATAMAAIGAFGAATGRPTSSLRALALAVVGLLLCDPLLVSSLGFRLSVAGAGGIILGASPIQERLPGPAWVTTPLAVTLAAQAAVAPLLVAAFGSVVLASLPANLLAVPAAAPLTMWGLTAGLVAGVVGDPVASLLHLPSRVLLWWIDLVATTAARWPLGSLQAPHLLTLGTAVVLAGVAGAARPPPDRWGWLRPAAAVLTLVTLLAALVLPTKDGRATERRSVADGVELWTGPAVLVVLDGRANEARLLSELRHGGASRVDVAVLSTDAARAVEVGRLIRDRWPNSLVLAPPAVVEAIPQGEAPPTGTTLEAGSLRVTFTTTKTRLTVDVLDGRRNRPGQDRARGPPEDRPTNHIDAWCNEAPGPYEAVEGVSIPVGGYLRAHVFRCPRRAGHLAQPDVHDARG